MATITSRRIYTFLSYSYLYPTLTRNLIVPGSQNLGDPANKAYLDALTDNTAGNFFITADLPIIATTMPEARTHPLPIIKIAVFYSC